MRCSRVWFGYRHQHWGVAWFFVKWRYSPERLCRVFTWSTREASLLVLPATVPSGLWLFGIRYFGVNLLIDTTSKVELSLYIQQV